MQGYNVSNFVDAFNMLKPLGREIAYEQMSKSGEAVKKSMRSSMKSKFAHMTTRVGVNGAYLQHTPKVQFGHRESMKVDSQDATPDHMEHMINSFMMEKSGTLAVGGMNPRFRPTIRRDGEIVGVGSPVGAVGKETAAILHRMDEGKIIDGYNESTRLYDGDIGRHYARSGINRAMAQVQAYLTQGFSQVFVKVQNNMRFTEKRYG